MVVKWSQWDSVFGMVRCGERELSEVMRCVRGLGLDAKKHLDRQSKPHAVYARKMYGDSGELKEIRLYCNVYMTDEELEKASKDCPHDILYVAHKF